MYSLKYLHMQVRNTYFQQHKDFSKSSIFKNNVQCGLTCIFLWFSSVQFSRSVVSDSQGPHGLQPTRLLCPWDLLLNNIVVISGEQQRDSAIHIHVSILPQTPLPSGLPRNTEQSSLCGTVGPCRLFILNTAVCIYTLSNNV